MTAIIPAADIERIVGARRHPAAHLARAVSAEQTVYVLHSQECVDTTADLRTCSYSVALDRGIDVDEWPEDEPVVVIVEHGHLAPELGDWPDDLELDVRACTGCGCTDAHACDGGCWWIGATLCSSCGTDRAVL